MNILLSILIKNFANNNNFRISLLIINHVYWVVVKYM